MSRIFSQDSGFVRILSTVMDLLILNLLTLLCALPVVTAGASVTAMHYCLIRIVRREGSSVGKDFFRSFRQNLKQGAILEALTILAAGIFWLESKAVPRLPESIGGIYGKIFYVLAALCGSLALYAYPMLARFENTIAGILKNSAVTAIVYWKRTVLMLGIVCASGYLYAWMNLYILPLILLLGITAPGYLCARLYDPVFRILEQADPL